MEKIVSHKPPRHMDDWLGISLVKALYPQAQIEYVHPQQVPEEYLVSKDICVIDVGMRYEPELNNFDHHQNLELPSSVVLVLKHFYPHTDASARFLQAIDITDRFGFREAVRQGLTKENKATDEKRKTLLLTDISNTVANTVAQAVKFAVKMDTTYENFVELLYSLLSQTEELQKAKEQIEREKQELERKLREVKVIEINGIKVGISTESLAPYHYEVFQRTGIDMLVERNSVNYSHLKKWELAPSHKGEH